MKEIKNLRLRRFVAKYITYLEIFSYTFVVLVGGAVIWTWCYRVPVTAKTAAAPLNPFEYAVKADDGTRPYTTGHLKDPAGLALKLRDAEDPLSKYISRECLANDTRQLLHTYDGKGATAQELQKALIRDLNRLIHGPCVYAPGRFRHVKLSDDTQSLLNTRPAGGDLVRLNRLLLAEAYPGMIAQSPPCVIVKFANGVKDKCDVVAGRPLATICADPNWVAQYSAMEQLRSAFERMKNFVESGNATESDNAVLKDMERRLDKWDAQKDNPPRLVAVKSPATGMLWLGAAAEGKSVGQDQKLFVIKDFNVLQAKVTASGKNVQDCRTGLKAIVEVEPAQKFETLVRLDWDPGLFYRDRRDQFSTLTHGLVRDLLAARLKNGLCVSDIEHWRSFCTKINKERSESMPRPGKRIWSLLPADVRSMVEQAARGHSPAEGWKSKIVDALNHLLANREFYRKEDFQDVVLTKKAKDLLSRDRKGLSEQDVQTLNRLLLQASYPQEIAKKIRGKAFRVEKDVPLSITALQHIDIMAAAATTPVKGPVDKQHAREPEQFRSRRYDAVVVEGKHTGAVKLPELDPATQKQVVEMITSALQESPIHSTPWSYRVDKLKTFVINVHMQGEKHEPKWKQKMGVDPETLPPRQIGMISKNVKFDSRKFICTLRLINPDSGLKERVKALAKEGKALSVTGEIITDKARFAMLLFRKH